MARVTRIGSSSRQVQYRLTQMVGCAHESHLPLDAAHGEPPLIWVGRGLPGVGISAGTVLGISQHGAAHALMRGQHPHTRQPLVRTKTIVAEAAKVRAAPLVDAVLAEAARRGITPQELWRTQRQQLAWRQVRAGAEADPATYTVAARVVNTLAKAAALDPHRIYGDDFTAALSRSNERVPVGNRGYDITVTFPKSFSTLIALAPPPIAAGVERCLEQAAREGFEMLERYTGYVMRGHHGDGHTAKRLGSGGLLGWMSVHHTSRAGDPHWHAHITIANMVRGADGKWSTVAAGGRDLMNHVHLLGAFAEARARRLIAERYGLRFERSRRTGRWEAAGVPGELLRLFSKRDNEIRAELARRGTPWELASPARRRTAANRTREAKTSDTATADDETLRARWRREAQSAGFAVDRHIRLVLGKTGPRPAAGPDVARLAGALFDPDQGLTARATAFTRRALMARLCEELPDGIGGGDQLEQTATAVLAAADLIPMPPAPGTAHLSNNDRYTTTDLVEAEQSIVESTETEMAAGLGVVDPPTAAMALQIFQAGAGYVFDTEQRAVFDRLTRAGHGIDAVIGVPGSGKTSLMCAARIAWEAAGYTVAGGATAAIAADHLRRSAGLSAAGSLAFWLTLIEYGDGLRGIDVLIVDEAAMADSRDLAVLLAHAADTGTKIVEIGDPHQLSSPGVGGAFAAQHRIVGGLELTTNRRQPSSLEREALTLFRARDHLSALRTWARAGQLVATVTPDEAMAATVADWWSNWSEHDDPYERISAVLMLAHRNDDVADLNLAARGLARQAGHLRGRDVTFARTSADPIAFAVGDVVMTRINNYRAARGDGVNVLNGRRGLLTHIDRRTRQVTIAWRGDDGRLEAAELDAGYIAVGGLDHAYALTVHKAEGQTVGHVSMYSLRPGRALLYTGMSRHTVQARVFQPATALTEEIPLEQWDAMTTAQRTALATELAAEQLNRQRPATMAIEELGYRPPPPRTVGPAHHTTQSPPTTGTPARHQWLRLLGPVPIDETERRPWARLAGAIAAYRADHAITGADPLGPEPANPHQRADWAEISELLARFTHARVTARLGIRPQRRQSSQHPTFPRPRPADPAHALPSPAEQDTPELNHSVRFNGPRI